MNAITDWYCRHMAVGTLYQQHRNEIAAAAALIKILEEDLAA